MDLIQVDVVRPQTLQAGFAVGDDVVIVEVPGIDLGGDDRPVPAALQGLAHHLLGLAVSVPLRRVNEVHAVVQGAVDGLDGRLVVAGPPDVGARVGPGAQGQS